MFENTCRIGGTALIGHTPENNARELRFDIGKWQAAWPDATPEMLVVRPDEDVTRPVVTRVEGNWIIWTVRRYDTAIAGSGRMWVIFSGADGEMLGETPVTGICVMPGPPNVDGEEPPETEIPWMSKTLNAASRAEDAAKRAEDAADRVQAGGGTGGGSGETGEDGGYYMPSVTDAGDLSWQASKEGMPEVPGANIKGPAGTDGKDYVLTEADKQEIAGMVKIPEGPSVELDTTLKVAGKAADAKATGDALNELKEANDAQDKLIGNKLDASELPTAINTALAQAKESGEFDGKDGDPGYTPQKGVDYFDGEPGEDGKSATLTLTGADSLPYGSAPTVTELPVSTPLNRYYRLGIPEGKPGADGEGGGSGSYTLPIASPDTLGGVKPVAATDEMTQAVGVDELGGLWALPGGDSGKLNGVILADITTTEEVSFIDVEIDGTVYRDIFIYMKINATSTNEGNYNKNVLFALNDAANSIWNAGVLFNGAIQQYGKWGYAHLQFWSDQYKVQSCVNGSNMAFSTEKTMWVHRTVEDYTTDGLKKIRILAENGATRVFGVGTKLEIYGVPA